MGLPSFQAPRGTSDVLPVEQRDWARFQAKAEEHAANFGYERIDTPIFEDARLFVRSIGEVTDIVEKETYTFEDRGGDLLTLRPEGTAPVCRAYLQHGMHNLPQPVRMYYLGPFFRYDRPQAGRYRELHQFGIEAIGESDAFIDVEVIEFAWRVLESLGINDVSLLLNSIGDPKCRPDYTAKLQPYFRSRADELCPDCKRRLETTPMRLLDCKRESCQPAIAEAPDSVSLLCEECASHWHTLLEQLRELGLPYQIDKRLVRGLDYYTRTVFEIVPPREGQQSTLVAGGRYDGLMEELGGRPTPGIGFGMGIERILLNLKRREAPEPEEGDTKVLIAYVGPESKSEGLGLSSRLRREGVASVLAPSGRSLKSQLRYASAIKATHAVILGDLELSKGAVTMRDLAKSEQHIVSQAKLLQILKSHQA